MGRVYDLSMKRKKAPEKELPKEFSARESQLVKRLHKQLHEASRGYHDVIICKAIGVFMGDVMVMTDHPGMVIGGFMKHIQAVANLAIAQHKAKEQENAPKVYGTKHPEDGQAHDAPTGQPGPQDSDPPQSGDRGVEGPEDPQVPVHPTLQ